MKHYFTNNFFSFPEGSQTAAAADMNYLILKQNK